MSTRSCVAIPAGDGFSHGRYIHSDGYPTYNGIAIWRAVKEAENTDHAIRKLIMSRAGQAGYSTAGPDLAIVGYDSSNYEAWRTFLGRDGEEPPTGDPHDDLGICFAGRPDKEFLWIEWSYVIGADGLWVYRSEESGETVTKVIPRDGRTYESPLYMPTLSGVLPWDAELKEIERMAGEFEGVTV